jgi:DNA (cytosine-5)-methyltransferase 1
MREYKILNLYACLGGNRYKWDEVGKEAGIKIDVTAVELDPELARLYQERFPNDKVLIEDAHQYLLDHYQKFDFIWSSPPCPTHSRLRKTNTGEGERQSKASYPDMKLWQEIIFLNNFFKGKYCVENVISYYEPMFSPKKRDRHYYWTNFNLPNKISNRYCKVGTGKNEFQNLCTFHDYDFKKYKGNQRKDKIARNLVDYEAGRTILETALEVSRKQNVRQSTIFDALP